jgi:hypothetical protein
MTFGSIGIIFIIERTLKISDVLPGLENTNTLLAVSLYFRKGEDLK